MVMPRSTSGRISTRRGSGSGGEGDEDMGRMDERDGTMRAGRRVEARGVGRTKAGVPTGGCGDARCAGGRPSATAPVRVALAARRVVAARGGDGGAATAEYAIATMAAVAFAGLLVVILQSDEVRGMLLDLVRRALTYDR
jgi:hypothetical protein